MAVGDNVERWYATGKRKTAVARVWLRVGTGNIAVNRRAFETYFPRETSRLVVMQPFEVTEQVGRFDVFATLAGGGISGLSAVFQFSKSSVTKICPAESRAYNFEASAENHTRSTGPPAGEANPSSRKVGPTRRHSSADTPTGRAPATWALEGTAASITRAMTLVTCVDL